MPGSGGRFRTAGPVTAEIEGPMNEIRILLANAQAHERQAVIWTWIMVIVCCLGLLAIFVILELAHR